MAPLTTTILNLLRRSPNTLASVAGYAKRTALSPSAVFDTLQRRDDSSDPNSPKYNPGGGAAPADSFNNNALLITFAVIASLMVLCAIWFCTIARNGGFHWHQGDWDDYKSTVLRRKGPDGKTLSNATKSTKLGGGSIIPKWRNRWSGKASNKSGASDFYDKYTDVSTSSPAKSVVSSIHDSDVEMQESPRRHTRTPTSNNRHSHQKRDSRLRNDATLGEDPEFDAYQAERPAAVGGYNKPAEGSHYDYTNSEVSGGTPTKMSKKDRKAKEQREKEMRTRQQQTRKSANRSPPQHVSATNSQQSQPHGVAFPSPSAKDRTNYYSNYRPTGQPTLRTVPPEEARANSQRASQHRRSIPSFPGSYAEDFDHADLAGSYVGSEDTGTKSYKHHIPGLPNRSEVGVDDSVSRVGVNPRHSAEPPKRGGGFRRFY
jgi:hypothetical protein